VPLLLAPALLAACDAGRASAPAAEAPVPVQIAPVVTEAVSPPIHGTGVLGAKEDVTLSFKVGGVIERIAVDEGAVVVAGQTLAALHTREIDARVAGARSAFEKAERDLARAERLHADSVATLEQVQDARTGLDAARAALDAAEFDRRYAVITAPAAGVILRRFAEPSELVAPGEEVLVLGSRARGSVVRVGLADRDVVRVRAGDPATVRFAFSPPPTLEGTVTEIAAAADPATGTFRVEVSVPGGASLPSGLIADVEIRPRTDGDTPLVPVDALLEADGSRATVFTVGEESGRAERRDVSIAFLAGDRVAVAAGLEGVRHVVTAGATRLDDGDSVVVLP
jgi:RND family efflux transporter MFP subunit